MSNAVGRLIISFSFSLASISYMTGITIVANNRLVLTEYDHNLSLIDLLILHYLFPLTFVHLVS